MSAVDELLANLADQVRVYRRLHDLCEQQLDALLQQRPSDVAALLEEIELTMIERGKVDRGRSGAICRVADEFGIAVEDVSVSRLTVLAEPDLAQQLNEYSDELRTLAHDLDGVVERNAALLQQELQIIDHLVQGITEIPDHSPTYQRSGCQRDGGRRKLLDMQV